MASKPAKELKKGDRIEFPGLEGKEQGEVFKIREDEFEGQTTLLVNVETEGGFMRPRFEPDESVTVLDGED